MPYNTDIQEQVVLVVLCDNCDRHGSLAMWVDHCGMASADCSRCGNEIVIDDWA